MNSDDKIKSSVTVMVVGFERNASFTVPHLMVNLSNAVEEAGYRLNQMLVVVTYSSKKPRIKQAIHQILENRGISTRNLGIFLYETRELEDDDSHIYRLASRNGNPYPKRPTSLWNTVHFLNLLRIANSHAGRESDYILFCRSDLLLLDKARLMKDLSQRTSVDFRLPKWHRWGGHNDRIAFFSYHARHLYLNRIEKSVEYLSKGHKLHGERFLAYCLRNQRVSTTLSPRLLRTRSSQVIVMEDFNATSINSPLKTIALAFRGKFRL